VPLRECNCDLDTNVLLARSLYVWYGYIPHWGQGCPIIKQVVNKCKRTEVKLQTWENKRYFSGHELCCFVPSPTHRGVIKPRGLLDRTIAGAREVPESVSAGWRREWSYLCYDSVANLPTRIISIQSPWKLIAEIQWLIVSLKSSWMWEK
jgi:hypothetical protein